MYIFYTPDVSGDLYTLSEQESKHAVKVLRLVEGSNIHLIDGVGGLYNCKIVEAHHKRCSVEIISVEREYEKRSYSLWMAVAPTKSIDRTEWFVEKATEIGVDRITPIQCRYSERKQLKEDRIRKVTVSASKQSLKAYVPQVDALTSLDSLFKMELPAKRYIAHCEDADVKPHLSRAISLGDDAIVLIGPEGDFSPEEIAKAREHGFQDISLGTSRLRTETAAVVAVHTVSMVNIDSN